VKRASLLVSLLLVASAQAALAASAPPPAPLLTFVERDIDGDSHDVTPGAATVDINSTIGITIDRAVLAARLGGASGSETAALVADYVTLQNGITELTRALSQPAADKTGSLRARAGLILLNYATSAPKDAAPTARPNRFRAALDRALDSAAGQSTAAQFLALQQAGHEEIDRLQQELNAALAKEGVRLMLGAWLGASAGTQPVHLPGFDSYADQTRYEVERFRLVFTDEQRQQYQNAATAAKMINAGGGAAVAQAVVLDLAARSFPETLKALQALRQDCDNLVAAAEKAAPPLAAEVKVVAVDLGQQAKWLEATITSLADTAKTNPAGLPAAATAAIREATTRLAAVEKEVDGLRKDLTSAVAALQTPAREVLDAAAALKRAVDAEASTVWGEITAGSVVANLNAATLEFGDKVKRFELADLPATSQLDLELTGPRADGDEVVIKLGVQKGTASPNQDVEIEQLRLRRMLVHVETSAGLVFANRPRQPSDTGGKTPFQAAPAYSAFLKKGWRGCAFWNNVLNPGLGISVAALDFNLDGVPEVGIGAALSIVRDWLQGGIGYNVAARRWYGFVGVGLPLPTFGMTTTSNTSAGK